MNNYDIGILTFWNVPNYGTYAQAYALQKIIKNIVPHRSVLQINYLDKKHFSSYYSLFTLTNILKSVFHWDHVKFKKRETALEFLKKKDCFEFAYQQIPSTIKFTKYTLRKAKFNTIVLGSDIIWDYSFKNFNRDKFLFGNWLNCSEIISYATSFGTVKDNNHHPQYVIKGLLQMKNVSVRDENSLNIVNRIIGNKPEIVLDPVWLWDFSKDEKLEKPLENKYLIVYGEGFSDNFVNELLEYKKIQGIKLICIECNNDNNAWCDKSIKQYELSPFQWISYLKYADSVATSTYHGLMFSLMFHKRTAFYASGFIIAKSQYFLTKTGLLSLFSKYRDNPIKMLMHDYNYEAFDNFIDHERKKSKEYLRQVLIREVYER